MGGRCRISRLGASAFRVEYDLRFEAVVDVESFLSSSSVLIIAQEEVSRHALRYSVKSIDRYTSTWSHGLVYMSR